MTLCFRRTGPGSGISQIPVRNGEADRKAEQKNYLQKYINLYTLIAH